MPKAYSARSANRRAVFLSCAAVSFVVILLAGYAAVSALSAETDGLARERDRSQAIVDNLRGEVAGREILLQGVRDNSARYQLQLQLLQLEMGNWGLFWDNSLLGVLVP